MLEVLRHRRTASLAMMILLALTTVPMSVSASNHHTAARTAVAFTFTTVEFLEEPSESTDAAGIFHYIAITREELTGDISGTGVVEFRADFKLLGECNDEICIYEESGWADVRVTAADGGWVGTFVYSGSTVPGEEFYSDTLVLRGTGSNAHESIVAHSTTSSEEAISFEGLRSTLPMPRTGLSTNVRLCLNADGSSFTGGFLSGGTIEGSGAASGDIMLGGGSSTHTRAATGTLQLNDERGSVTIAYAGGAQDNFTPSVTAIHIWGHFVIIEGTGEYAELYGSGRIIGTAGAPMDACASGFGANFSMYGESHVN